MIRNFLHIFPSELAAVSMIHLFRFFNIFTIYLSCIFDDLSVESAYLSSRKPKQRKKATFASNTRFFMDWFDDALTNVFLHSSFFFSFVYSRWFFIRLLLYVHTKHPNTHTIISFDLPFKIIHPSHQSHIVYSMLILRCAQAMLRLGIVL